MSSGIYSLNFKHIPNKYYVGFATDLNNRKYKHISLLRHNKHHNILLQDIYNEINEFPLFSILETCEISSLGKKEIEWITKLDSRNNGYNLTTGGQLVGLGANHPNSLYNKEIYEEILLLLANTTLTAKQISEILKVSKIVIQDIACLNSHTYLKEIYPIEYAILENKLGNRVSGKSSAKEQGIVYPLIISPEGVIHNVENTRKFSRDNNLDQAALWRVLKGKNKTHKGWKIYCE